MTTAKFITAKVHLYNLRWTDRLVIQQTGPYYHKLQSFGAKYKASGLFISYITRQIRLNMEYLWLEQEK